MSVKGDEISLTWDIISYMGVSCPGVFLLEANKSYLKLKPCPKQKQSITQFSVTVTSVKQ